MGERVEDLRDTIVPQSDQLNADDLLTGPITVRVEGVRRGTRDQPVAIHIDGGHRPYMPCKSMRRVLIAAWGNDGREWVGRRISLFRDPEVIFGGVKVGGIRISHLSRLDKALELPLMVTRGRRKPYRVEPLVEPEPSEPAVESDPGRAADVAALMDESLRGRLKAALATYALGEEFATLGAVRDFLMGLDAEAFGLVRDSTLPPVGGGGAGEE